jgi:hypothetical protein
MTAVGNIGTATIDFGATPVADASVAVTGQTDITATAYVEAWFMARSTAENDAEAHKQAAAVMRVVCSEPTAGVGFTITAYCLQGAATGTFKVEWTWSD